MDRLHCTEGSVDTYTCECVGTGYEGENCVDVADECISSPCDHDGACMESTADATVDVGTYYCSCAPGYSGFNCDGNVDECSSSPCQHDGQCQDGVNGYSCDCAGHTAGENCDSCVAGFDGVQCEHNIDECSSSPCLNGGQCNDGVDSYACVCADGWQGGNCETGPCCSQIHCNLSCPGSCCYAGCSCYDCSSNQEEYCDQHHPGWDAACDRGC